MSAAQTGREGRGVARLVAKTRCTRRRAVALLRKTYQMSLSCTRTGHIVYWHWLGLAGLLLLSCRAPEPPPASTEERVATALNEKLEGWLARRRSECRAAALVDAQQRADSLVLDYAFAQKMMLDRPGRPMRPPEPPLLRPSDTLELRPFLPDTF